MPSVLIDSVYFRHQLNPLELSVAVADLGKARLATSQIATQYREAIGNDAAAEQHARELLLSSPQSVLCSIINANKKMKIQRRGSLDRCVGLAKTLQVGAEINEKAKARIKSGKSGVRFTFDFGLKNRAVQDAVSRVMGPILKPRKFQYTLLGVQAGIADVKDVIKSGLVYAARLDIEDYFGSFTLEKLAPELPLPFEVVEHAVVARHLKVELDKSQWMGHHNLLHALHSDDLLLLARRGLPPGSGCAPIISTYCMSRLDWKSSTALWLLNYVDDFLLLALTMTQLEEAIGKLTEAVAKLPGGQFKLKLLGKSMLTQGVEFLGHNLQLVDGTLKTTASVRNTQNLLARWLHMDEQLNKFMYLAGHKDPKKALVILAEMSAYLEGWRNAFRECDDVDRYATALRDDIEQRANVLGISSGLIKAAIDPSMGYRISSYALNK